MRSGGLEWEATKAVDEEESTVVTCCVGRFLERKADEGLEESEKKIAKLTEELAGIDEANQKNVTKRNQ